MSGSGEADAGGGGGAVAEGCSGAPPAPRGRGKIGRCYRGRAPPGGEAERHRGTKTRLMRAGRGLSRLTGAAAPRPGLWPDDEERAPEWD
jgi:hypothetical protein